VERLSELEAIGALLRREGLYSTPLSAWRRQRDRGALEALRGRRLGRKSDPAATWRERIATLEAEKARLEECLRQAEAIIAAPKNLSEILGRPEAAPRERVRATALALAPTAGMARAADAFGVPRASLYRARYPAARAVASPRPAPPRALTPPERLAVLEILHSERFVDQAPKTVYATLLDEGRYLCSWRTMYRVLAAADEVRERCNQLRHPASPKPELLATGPNQVWSWDITTRLGPAKGIAYALYGVLDIFSRYVVGWMVAEDETAALAERLLAAACATQGIAPGQLTIHADRGHAMTAKSVALLLANLGVRPSHGRPRVSDDNPYSEAQFKTLKYHPTFPERFGSVQDARVFCRGFFDWYNTELRHDGLGLLTPEVVHSGRTEAVLERCRAILAAAYAAHPERFVRKPPERPAPPPAVWINRPGPAVMEVPH
jgi:putative transposase